MTDWSIDERFTAGDFTSDERILVPGWTQDERFTVEVRREAQTAVLLQPLGVYGHQVKGQMGV